MAEIRLELLLNRATGALAGIVASLAQAGLELLTQKIDRTRGDSAIRLMIVARGPSPEPVELARQLNQVRGVAHLARIEVDDQPPWLSNDSAGAVRQRPIADPDPAGLEPEAISAPVPEQAAPPSSPTVEHREVGEIRPPAADRPETDFRRAPASNLRKTARTDAADAPAAETIATDARSALTDPEPNPARMPDREMPDLQDGQRADPDPAAAALRRRRRRRR